MCGIIGVVSRQYFNSLSLVSMLKKLEYRGYDSSGIAILDKNFYISKSVGKISNLERVVESNISGKFGIAHTRWATTGAVTEMNAHPHTDCSGNIAIVHNGIIENYPALKDSLIKRGHRFVSETDSEVIAHLLEDMPPEHVLKLLEGRNAFLALHKNSKMIAAKNGSPLVIGVDKHSYYIASDVLPFLEKTDEVIFLEDGDVATINEDGISFSGNHRPVQRFEWDIKNTEKGNYPHFIIKEILEQPSVLEIFADRNENILEIAHMINKSFGSFFIGCGTASYAALVASYYFSAIAKKHINFCVGSEFPLHKHFLTDRSLVIAVSQSGETADILEAVKAAKENNAKIVSIVNVPGSTLMRSSDYSLLTPAGAEKAVCSTKAFTLQISAALLLSYASAGRFQDGLKLLKETSCKIKGMLTDEYMDKIKSLAKHVASKEHIYVIGKGFNYPIALEAALKIKEVSYIHAEGFASGELKHGVIALIERNTPCIALVANDETKQDVLTGAAEIKLRGGFIIGVAPQMHEVFDFWVPVPDAGNASPIVNVIPMQLLAYYLALERGCDPDYCRNLAKCVTVK